jgi:hypothetical protein
VKKPTVGLLLVLFGCGRVEPALVRSPLVGASPLDIDGEGHVAEVLPAGSYTYLRLEGDEDGVWHVISDDPPYIGDRLRYHSYAERAPFHSARLDRDFPRLVFSASRGVTR